MFLKYSTQCTNNMDWKCFTPTSSSTIAEIAVWAGDGPTTTALTRRNTTSTVSSPLGCSPCAPSKPVLSSRSHPLTCSTTVETSSNQHTTKLSVRKSLSSPVGVTCTLMNSTIFTTWALATTTLRLMLISTTKS
jgi:hypothetical protein